MYNRRAQIEKDGSGSFDTFLRGLVVGVILGGFLGVILAPHRGDITRRKVVRKAGDAKDQVVEAVEQQMQGLKAQKGISDADQATDN